MPLLGTLLKQFIEVRSEINLRTRNPKRQQHTVLKKLLRKAQMTAFGVQYNFNDILLHKNLEEKFASSIPVFDYNKIFKEWWHLSLEGESDVCWPG